MRLRMVALPSKTVSSAFAKSSISGTALRFRDQNWYSAIFDSRKGSKNPKVPMEKLRTGGTAPTLNNEDACKIVPSPPNVTTRSIFSEFAPRN